MFMGPDGAGVGADELVVSRDGQPGGKSALSHQASVSSLL